MASVEVELLLTALAAMMSPTTLSFSVFALVLGDRPLRTGFFFFLGALGATLAVGAVAAVLLGGDAAPQGSSTPKTWVSVLDIVFAVLILAYVVRVLRRPFDPQKTAAMIDRMSGVASSPAIAIVGAGAALANPGGFIPIALKDISQLNLGTAQAVAYWALFSLVTLLPLAVALLMLLVAHDWALAVLGRVRLWLERNARTIAAVIVVLLAAVLMRNGIVGLTA